MAGRTPIAQQTPNPAPTSRIGAVGGHNYVSVNFITVNDTGTYALRKILVHAHIDKTLNTTVASLRGMLSTAFIIHPIISHLFFSVEAFATHGESVKSPGLRLLDAIEKSTEIVGNVSDTQSQLLLHINSSDPNDSQHSEDDQNESWGHSLFRIGGMQWGAILTHWPGNEYTRQLLAAALRTCKIARHVCFERKVDARAFLSDHYLEMVSTKLWDLWIAAGGVGYLFPVSAVH